MRVVSVAIAVGLVVASIVARPLAAPAPRFVAVRHPQGSLHGFLTLRSLDGEIVADGDAMQSVKGDRIVSRTVFDFRDGSVSDETAEFTQHGSYRLVSDHVVMRGPTFPHPLTMDLDVAKGHAVVHTKDEHGEEKVDDESIVLPADLANGILPTLLQEVTDAQLPLTLSMVAATPAPRLVKLVITKVGTSPFAIGKSPRTSIDYLVHIDIGGVTGILAEVFGKQPPDSHLWVLGGDEPVFVKSEAPMYPGGPVLRTELAIPQWPH